MGLPGPGLALQEGLKRPEWPGDQPSGRVPLPSPATPTGPLHPAEKEAPRPGYPNGMVPGEGGRLKRGSLSRLQPHTALPTSLPHRQAAPSRDCWLKMAFPPPPLLASGFSRANRPSTRSFLPPSAGDDSFARASIYLEKVDLAPGCSKPGRAISEAEQGPGVGPPASTPPREKGVGLWFRPRRNLVLELEKVGVPRICYPALPSTAHLSLWPLMMST